MKIVCINNKELDRDSNGKSRLTKMSLTIGKTYDAIFMMQKYNEKIKFYLIENNDGESKKYETKHFVSLNVWREQQLNRLI